MIGGGTTQQEIEPKCEWKLLMGNQRRLVSWLILLKFFDTFTLNVEMVLQSMDDVRMDFKNRKPGWNRVEGSIYFITLIPVN